VPDDLRDIRKAASKIDVQGERFSVPALAMVQAVPERCAPWSQSRACARCEDPGGRRY
jgi:hypothetical protein